LRALVTGGLGFIGSNLCKRLLRKGYEVICVDNLSTGNKANIMEFMFDPNFHLILHDITSSFPTANVDLVIHCATPDLKDPIHYLKTCSYGAFNVAGVVRRNKARLIYLSGANFYGKQNQEINELDFYRVNFDNAEAVGLQMTESILNSYKGLDIRILRIFDSYGPKMPKNNLIRYFIDQTKKGEKILVGNLTDQYACCYIDDILDGICCAMEMDEFQGPINLGSSSYYTVAEIVRAIEKVTEMSVQVVCNRNEDKTLNSITSIKKAQGRLRWSEKVDLDEGLKKTIEYYAGRKEC